MTSHDAEALARDEIRKLRDLIYDLKPYMDYEEVRLGVKNARREIDNIERWRKSFAQPQSQKSEDKS